jgi:predicted  nucleic acid-binding Zn-ribbon protein
LNPSDKSKSSTSRKGPKKAPAQDLETQIAEMMAARDVAQKQAMDLHSGFQDLSRRAAELETQVGELDQELKKAREEAARAGARAQDLSSQVSRIAGLEAEAAALRKRLDESLAEHARLQTELKKLQESRDAAEQENARLRKQSGDRNQQETLAEALRKQIEEARSAGESSRRELEEARKRLEESRQDHGGLKAELKKLQETTDAALMENARLRMRAADLDLQVKRAAGAGDVPRRELEEARKRLEESRAEELRLQAELKKARETVDAAQKESIQLRTKAADLDQQVQRAAGTGDSSRRELEESRAELKKVQQTVDAAQKENAQFRWKSAELDQQLKRAQADLKMVQELREAAEQEAARLKTQGGELEGLVDGMDEELQKAREDVAKADARSAELESLVGGLEKDLEQAGEEAGNSAARAADLEKRAGQLGQELSAQTSRAARLDQEGAALRQQVAQEAAAREEQRRNLDVARQRVMEFTEEHHRLFGEQKQVQENLGAACTENSELKAQRASLADQLKAAEGRIAESSRRLEALQRELAEAKKWEAKARDAESQAAQARETASIRFADLARLEKMRAEQDRHVVDLRSTVADLERRLQEAGADPPVPEPVLIVPPPAAPPAEKPPSIFDEAPPAPPPPAAPVAETIPPAVSVPKPADETTLRPQNWFGPPGEDGQPAHVLMEILSRDSMGVLYRASERASGRQFAVRFMSGQAGEEQTRAIEREVEKLISLPHPNILHVQGSGRRKNRLYFAMDLVEGQTLGQAKIQEIPRLCAILRDAAAAVHYAHEEGIFHGDLNPENIIVGRDGDKDQAIVKDFALGHFLETVAASSAGKDAPPVIRNPAYLPPEQVRVLKSALSAAVDVYGLGATLYAMLAGRPPFEGKDAAQITKRIQIEEPPPIERVRPDVPPAVAAVARRAMAKERGLRYATMQELADALTKFLDGH